MDKRDTIEFYCDDKIICSLHSSMCLAVGSYINMKKTTYKIEYISFTIDHADSILERSMRCNVELMEQTPSTITWLDSGGGE